MSIFFPLSRIAKCFPLRKYYLPKVTTICYLFFFINIFKLLFIDVNKKKEGGKHWFAVPFIYAFIGCFLYVQPWCIGTMLSPSYPGRALYILTMDPVHKFVHFERNWRLRSCSGHWSESQLILHVTAQPLSPQPHSHHSHVLLTSHNMQSDWGWCQ